MLLNGGVYDGKRYISEASLEEMTRKQVAENIPHAYGYGFGTEGGNFGHGGAYKTNLNINPKLGLITVFMVQQGSNWPTKEGDKIQPSFQHAAEQLVPAPAAPSN